MAVKIFSPEPNRTQVWSPTRRYTIVADPASQKPLLKIQSRHNSTMLQHKKKLNHSEALQRRLSVARDNWKQSELKWRYGASLRLHNSRMMQKYFNHVQNDMKLQKLYVLTIYKSERAHSYSVLPPQQVECATNCKRRLVWSDCCESGVKRLFSLNDGALKRRNERLPGT